MVRRAGRWARAAAPIVILVGACSARPLGSTADAGAGAPPPGSRDGAAGGSIGGGSAGAGGFAGAGRAGTVGTGGAPGDGAAGSGAPGDAGVALCPPVDQPADPSPQVRLPVPLQAELPFPCQPLPAATFFPRPAAAVPGAYSRCASFDVGAATSVAVSPDGSMVALATADGIARLIEPAGQQVWAVLASPRATIDYVAYAHDGSAIMTLARAQREVTLWRAGDWTPVWRITLPGTPYYHLFGGGLAFAPDGKTAVVSPGSDTFLIDVASGAVQAHRAAINDAVLDVAYGWTGRRIVVAEPSLIAHCNHSPNGGTVTVLDAATLAPIATIADLGTYASPGGYRGIPQFRASPIDDLVLVPPTVDEPAGAPLRAFRVSDGGALPAPALAKLPAVFAPDGSVLIADGGALLRSGLADGKTTVVAMVGDVGPMALSRNGFVLAIGGSGQDLLRTWRNDGPGPVTAACSAAAPAGYDPKPASLSADGQTLAVATGTGVKVFARYGRLLATLPSPGSPYLSPSGALVAVKDPLPSDAAPAAVFRVAGAAKVGSVPYDSWNWASFAFSPRDDRVYSNGERDGAYRLDTVNLTTGASDIHAIPPNSVVIGTSGGCPVIYQTARGAWRACGGCDDPAVGADPTAFASDIQGAALSADGQYVALRPADVTADIALWSLPPDATQIASVPRRSAVGQWIPTDYPVAVAAGGGRVLIGGRVNASCWDGPQFEILVHDVASGAVIDHLPPGPAAADADARTIAYGPELWCAR